MIRSYLLLVLLPTCGFACSSQMEAEDPYLVDTTRLSADVPSETISAPLTSLSREQLLRTVDAGLPQFLRKIRVKASLNQGKFVGWEIVAFRDPSSWQGAGLLIGDVVTSINQQPIERDTQAFKVFISLKEAEVLEVVYLRAGQQMQLALPITGLPVSTDPSVPPTD